MSSFLLDILSKAVWAILCFISGWCLTQYQKMRKAEKDRVETVNDDLEVIKEALRHTLRGVLQSDYNCFVEQGWCSILEKEEFFKTYDTYAALKGNGIVAHMKDVVEHLPDTPH